MLHDRSAGQLAAAALRAQAPKWNLLARGTRYEQKSQETATYVNLGCKLAIWARTSTLTGQIEGVKIAKITLSQFKARYNRRFRSM